MKMRVVIDTNIWIRILLRGKITLPILEAFNANCIFPKTSLGKTTL
jgi:predicted nucleic acid-binding protein